MIRDDMIESAKLEKRILMNCENEFLIKIYFVFQTEDKVYFVMQFIWGGELFQYWKTAGWFDEERAKFYSVQIISALGYLHDNSIIYWDLKLENVLMDEDGYLILADLGLAKELIEEDTNTFCGTP